jgi:hypothetical protein
METPTTTARVNEVSTSGPHRASNTTAFLLWYEAYAHANVKLPLTSSRNHRGMHTLHRLFDSTYVRYVKYACDVKASDISIWADRMKTYADRLPSETKQRYSGIEGPVVQ